MGRTSLRLGALSILLVAAACGGDDGSPESPAEPEEPDPASEPVALEVSPESVSLDRWADTVRIEVRALDEAGNTVATPTLSWSSSDTAVVRVDDQGLLRSWRAGEAEISVEAASNSSLIASVVAEVAVQLNSRCSVPQDVPEPPPVRGQVAGWDFVPDAFGGAHLDYEGGNALAGGDFDGDGDQDVLVGDDTGLSSESPGRLLFWRNNGDETFRDDTEDFLEPDSVHDNGTRDFEVADFNGDGIPDLFRALQGFDADPFPGAANVLLLSRGGEALEDVSSTHLRPNDPGGFTHTSTALDVECDGDPDLFTSDLGSSNAPPGAHLYVNDGTGTLESENHRISAELTDGSLVAVSAASCDLDRDGDDDLVLGRWGTTNPELDHDLILVNDGFGHFRRVQADLPSSHFGSTNVPSDIACKDLDLDGWPDVIVGNSSGDTSEVDTHLNVWMNRGGLVFEEVTLFAQRGGTQSNRLHEVVDVDGDGWPDIVRRTFPQSNAILLNQGGSSFVPADIPHGGGFFVDVNGNGRLDVVWPGVNNDGGSFPPELFLQR